MLLRTRIACAFIFLWLGEAAGFATVRYRVTLADPARHLVQISMEIPAGRDTHELQLPVWNALYQIRDFVQFMNNVGAKDLSGRQLPLLQQNKSRWELREAGNGARIEYQMFSDDPDPFGAQVNSHHAFFNLAQILMYADDSRGEATEVEFRNMPAGWKIATSLAQQGTMFAATNYDELVDSPVEISAFSEKDFNGRCGRYRVVVDAPAAHAIFPKIMPPIERIVNTASLWMNDCPFQSYTFIYHFSDSPNSGGMEHAYSTAITIPIGNLRKDTEAFTAITTHEFFHLWDVKRIRPQSLEPVDYTKEDYTTALWFSEGVDSAAADLIRLRAGLLDEQGYLDRLSQAITELQNRPAHLTQSAEQSSLDAWLEKYPYFGLPERSISYYNKGELLGVLLDLKMRQATRGRESLQTLFRWMNEHYAKQGKVFDDSNGVRESAERLTNADFREFFAEYVSGVQEIPWNSFFEDVGLRVGVVEATLTHRGFDAVQKFDQPPTVVRVEPGSAAERAGLKSGDTLLSINSRAVSRNFEQQIEALGPSASLQLRIRRDGVPYDLQWKLEAQKMKIYHVEDLPSISREQRAERKAWLFGDASTPSQ
jgi:predicted metalloprotease with PDZ domain